jgi:hypothetical protein
MTHIPYISLGETIFNQHMENATAHLRRASFHFMCGKPEWAAACIAKANKDFTRAEQAYKWYSASPFDFLKGLFE